MFKLWYFVVCLVCLLSGVLRRHLAARAYDILCTANLSAENIVPAAISCGVAFVVRITDRTMIIDIINACEVVSNE